MLIYFWVALVISPAGFLEDLLGCSAICIVGDSNHIVSMLKCMCSQNNVIYSFFYETYYAVRHVPPSGEHKETMFYEVAARAGITFCALSSQVSSDLLQRALFGLMHAF